MRLRSLPLIAALVLLAGCASSRMVAQQSNPEYVGKPFKSVMVVAVTADEIVRRTYEDRIVALLDKRGLEGHPGYASIGERGKMEEAELRKAIGSRTPKRAHHAGHPGRPLGDAHIRARTLAVGIGWGGMYGYYDGSVGDGDASLPQDRERPALDDDRDAPVRREERQPCLDRPGGHAGDRRLKRGDDAVHRSSFSTP